MAEIILEKAQTNECEEKVEVIYSVTQPTQFILQTNSAVTATIYFENALIGSLTQTNPTKDVFLQGDYLIRIVGQCALAKVWAGDILDSPEGNQLGESCEDPLHVELCAEQALITPVEIVTDAAGATTDGLYQVTFTNLGALSAFINGISLQAGITVTYTAYHDPVTNQFKRIASIPYVAAGTLLRITEIP